MTEADSLSEDILNNPNCTKDVVLHRIVGNRYKTAPNAFFASNKLSSDDIKDAYNSLSKGYYGSQKFAYNKNTPTEVLDKILENSGIFEPNVDAIKNHPNYKERTVNVEVQEAYSGGSDSSYPPTIKIIDGKSKLYQEHYEGSIKLIDYPKLAKEINRLGELMKSDRNYSEYEVNQDLDKILREYDGIDYVPAKRF